MKLIKTITETSPATENNGMNAHEFIAKIYRNAETDEFIVRWFIDGEHQDEADYFTDEKGDAYATAHGQLYRYLLNESLIA